MNAFRYTARGNLVGVVSNGTAVLGLGAIGPLAAKPVMEGKAVLFKKFAGIDVFDIEVDQADPYKLVEVDRGARAHLRRDQSGGHQGAGMLHRRARAAQAHEDTRCSTTTSTAPRSRSAPRCSTGSPFAARKSSTVKLVVSGAGAAALACVDLLLDLGLRREHIWLTDLAGVVYEGRRELMDPEKARFAQITEARTLDEVIGDADVFLGLSAGGVLTPEMVRENGAEAPDPGARQSHAGNPARAGHGRRVPTPSSPPAAATTRTK